jgi:2-C-methyl-D-erythritol 4-phosphate cytidylyltransferase
MTIAVVVAAGRGLRLGGAWPKGLRQLCGRPLYDYSLEAALACPRVHGAVLVVPAGHFDLLSEAQAAGTMDERVRLCAGGATRQQSVLQGLLATPLQTQWVAVHDAARPLASSELWGAVIELAQRFGGALAAHPATDTLRRRDPGGRTTTLPRGELWHAETPQVFPKADLERALRLCESDGVEVTDEAEAMERIGASPALYHNQTANPKIATEADWHWVERLIQDRDAHTGAGRG